MAKGKALKLVVIALVLLYSQVNAGFGPDPDNATLGPHKISEPGAQEAFILTITNCPVGQDPTVEMWVEPDGRGEIEFVRTYRLWNSPTTFVSEWRFKAPSDVVSPSNYEEIRVYYRYDDIYEKQPCPGRYVWLKDIMPPTFSNVENIIDITPLPVIDTYRATLVDKNDIPWVFYHDNAAKKIVGKYYYNGQWREKSFSVPTSLYLRLKSAVTDGEKIWVVYAAKISNVEYLRTASLTIPSNVANYPTASWNQSVADIYESGITYEEAPVYVMPDASKRKYMFYIKRLPSEYHICWRYLKEDTSPSTWSSQNIMDNRTGHKRSLTLSRYSENDILIAWSTVYPNYSYDRDYDVWYSVLQPTAEGGEISAEYPIRLSPNAQGELYPEEEVSSAVTDSQNNVWLGFWDVPNWNQSYPALFYYDGEDWSSRRIRNNQPYNVYHGMPTLSLGEDDIVYAFWTEARRYSIPEGAPLYVEARNLYYKSTSDPDDWGADDSEKIFTRSSSMEPRPHGFSTPHDYTNNTVLAWARSNGGSYPLWNLAARRHLMEFVMNSHFAKQRTNVDLDFRIANLESDTAMTLKRDGTTIYSGTYSAYGKKIDLFDQDGLQELSVCFADGHGNTSAWYYDWIYLDRAVPKTPDLVRPSDGENGVDVKPFFVVHGGYDNSAECPYGATIQYTVQVSQSPGFGTYQTLLSENVDAEITTIGIPWSSGLTSLATNTTYYWRAQATDAAGNQSPFSVVWSFKTVSYDFSSDPARWTDEVGGRFGFLTLGHDYPWSWKPPEYYAQTDSPFFEHFGTINPSELGEFTGSPFSKMLKESQYLKEVGSRVCRGSGNAGGIYWYNVSGDGSAVYRDENLVPQFNQCYFSQRPPNFSSPYLYDNARWFKYCEPSEKPCIDDFLLYSSNYDKQTLVIELNSCYDYPFDFCFNGMEFKWHRQRYPEQEITASQFYQAWYDFVYRTVERYDGDHDFGTLDEEARNGGNPPPPDFVSDRDGYAPGDCQAPSPEFKASPPSVKFWLIGNEINFFGQHKASAPANYSGSFTWPSGETTPYSSTDEIDYVEVANSFAKVLSVAYKAAHDADPDARIGFSLLDVVAVIPSDVPIYDPVDQGQKQMLTGKDILDSFIKSREAGFAEKRINELMRAGVASTPTPTPTGTATPTPGPPPRSSFAPLICNRPPGDFPNNTFVSSSYRFLDGFLSQSAIDFTAEDGRYPGVANIQIKRRGLSSGTIALSQLVAGAPSSKVDFIDLHCSGYGDESHAIKVVDKVSGAFLYYEGGPCLSQYITTALNRVRYLLNAHSLLDKISLMSTEFRTYSSYQTDYYQEPRWACALAMVPPLRRLVELTLSHRQAWGELSDEFPQHDSSKGFQELFPSQTEEQQARELVKAYALALGGGMGKIMWFGLEDSQWVSHFNMDGSAGLIDDPNYSFPNNCVMVKLEYNIQSYRTGTESGYGIYVISVPDIPQLTYCVGPAHLFSPNAPTLGRVSGEELFDGSGWHHACVELSELGVDDCGKYAKIKMKTQYEGHFTYGSILVLSSLTRTTRDLEGYEGAKKQGFYALKTFNQLVNGFQVSNISGGGFHATNSFGCPPTPSLGQDTLVDKADFTTNDQRDYQQLHTDLSTCDYYLVCFSDLPIKNSTNKRKVAVVWVAPSRANAMQPGDSYQINLKNIFSHCDPVYSINMLGYYSYELSRDINDDLWITFFYPSVPVEGEPHKRPLFLVDTLEGLDLETINNDYLWAKTIGDFEGEFDQTASKEAWNEKNLQNAAFHWGSITVDDGNNNNENLDLAWQIGGSLDVQQGGTGNFRGVWRSEYKTSPEVAPGTYGNDNMLSFVLNPLYDNLYCGRFRVSTRKDFLDSAGDRSDVPDLQKVPEIRIRLTSGFHPNDATLSGVPYVNTQMSAEYVVDNPSDLSGRTFLDGTPDTLAPDAAGNTYRVFFYCPQYDPPDLHPQIDPLHAAIEVVQQPHQSHESILSLEGFDLVRIPPETLVSLSWSNVRSYSFTSNEEGWTKEVISGGDLTDLSWDGSEGALTIYSPNNHNNFDAGWNSPDAAQVEPDKLYKIEYAVKALGVSSGKVPELQLRVSIVDRQNPAVPVVKEYSDLFVKDYENSQSPRENPNIAPGTSYKWYTIYFYPDQRFLHKMPAQGQINLRFFMKNDSTGYDPTVTFYLTGIAIAETGASQLW